MKRLFIIIFIVTIFTSSIFSQVAIEGGYSSGISDKPILGINIGVFGGKAFAIKSLRAYHGIEYQGFNVSDDDYFIGDSVGSCKWIGYHAKLAFFEKSRFKPFVGVDIGLYWGENKKYDANKEGSKKTTTRLGIQPSIGAYFYLTNKFALMSKLEVAQKQTIATFGAAFFIPVE